MSKIKITLHLQESNRYIDIISECYRDCYKLLGEFTDDSFRVIECKDVDDNFICGVYDDSLIEIWHKEAQQKLSEELKREALSTLSEFKEGIPAMELQENNFTIPSQNKKLSS